MSQSKQEELADIRAVLREVVTPVGVIPGGHAYVRRCLGMTLEQARARVSELFHEVDE